MDNASKGNNTQLWTSGLLELGGSSGPIASETLDDVILIFKDELEDYGVDWDVLDK